MTVAPEAPTYAAGCVLSVDPLITFSKRQSGLPVGFASLEPGRFAAGPSLNFVGLTWSSATESEARRVAHDLFAAACALPKAKFVVVANTPTESLQLARLSVPNILANELMFVDERIFVPSAPTAAPEKEYEAVYVARLLTWKRHELARAVENLLLIYDHEPAAGEVRRVRLVLPRARFGNHEFNGGAYKHLPQEVFLDLVRKSAVGLCLSAREGSMRASLEYRLCGIPVVSTRSLGGRDRYFCGPHVRVVDDDPVSVARAVQDLRSRAFDPLAVREFVGSLIAFDRHNFLLNVNKIVEHELGVRDAFPSFAPFVRFPVAWRPAGEIFSVLDAPA